MMIFSDGHSRNDGRPLPSGDISEAILIFIVLTGAAVLGVAVVFIIYALSVFYPGPISCGLLLLSIGALVWWLGNKTFAALAIR